ncbi:PEP/pyruvate-binding domain-containing protein [Anaerolineales bacterium HSG24]|nr:PEP/pyruvate-binding domain-containing protein [Anaerolineales bacterium HSG24]
MQDMSGSSTPYSKILNLTLTLTNYPILAQKIRIQMRNELFVRGVIAPDVFEDEAQRKAIISQQMEGLTNPQKQEPAEIWERRSDLVRDNLTDFYFAYNLPYHLFQEIVRKAVNENRVDQRPKEVLLTFNPELAPWAMLFSQAEKYTSYPPELFDKVKHHLQQIIVVLLKGFVSDQLAFLGIARKVINIYDLRQIKTRRIGRGKIGGKSAGMYLAYKILIQNTPDDPFNFRDYIDIPETYFIGSDVYYDFKIINDFEQFTGHKYLSREEIEERYPALQKAYAKSRLSNSITEKLHGFLEKIGTCPIIVRSSSLLEDNFGSSFAGKYDSVFLPNQGTIEENLTALTRGIIQIYASVMSPDALFYRQAQNLDDYDERMAILIQKVQGEQYGDYFMPYLAGVGFSKNPFIWNDKLRAEDGFLRIVCGLGTRAVDRVDKDYPRMVGLSHPQLRPIKGADIIKYSQRFIDVLDLKENVFKTIPFTEVLSSDFSGIQFLASVDEGSFVKPIYALGKAIPSEKLVLTFDNMLKNTDFVKLMKAILKKLAKYYKCPVDIEFAVQLIPAYPKPKLKIFLLQCRPQSSRGVTQKVEIPTNILPKNQIFTTDYLVPQGVVDDIKYIIYIDPLIYSQIPKNSVRMEIARIVGKLNQRLEGEPFILMGPGRWGSSNIDLGVKVTYADIYNTRMLIEIAMTRGGITPEVSHGTHFFQDLVESDIYPLSLYPDKPGIIFKRNFLTTTKNSLERLLPKYNNFTEYINVIDVPKTCGGKRLRVAMNEQANKALGYLYK